MADKLYNEALVKKIYAMGLDDGFADGKGEKRGGTYYVDSEIAEGFARRSLDIYVDLLMEGHKLRVRVSKEQQGKPPDAYFVCPHLEAAPNEHVWDDVPGTLVNDAGAPNESNYQVRYCDACAAEYKRLDAEYAAEFPGPHGKV